MESDFTTRQHLESLGAAADSSFAEIMSRYRHAPVEDTRRTQTSAPSSISEALALGAIFGGNQRNQSNLDGVQISVNMDALRWAAVVILVIIFVWLFLKFATRKRSNPLKKRIKKIEKKLDMLLG